MVKFDYAVINLDREEYRIESIDKDNILGVVDFGLYYHFKKETYELNNLYDKNNILVFGTGLFAGSVLPGSNRITFVFRSPLYKTLFVSSMGGAGFILQKTGLDFFIVDGKSSDNLIILIKNNGKEFSIEFDNIEDEKLIEIWKKGGVYTLTDYIIDKYRDYYKDMSYRAIVVGPSALNTDFSAIFSQNIYNNKRVLGSEDWAGRGGGGSVMYKAHKVVAIVFGGKKDKIFEKYDLRDIRKINNLFKQIFGKNLYQVVREHTKKYYYDENLGSGGTFGGNYPSLKDLTPMLNWQMIYLEKERRIELFKIILEYYWKIFNEDIISKKSFKNCGEPCFVVCKKVYEDKKVEYEPYEANGPLSGIFYLKSSYLSTKKVEEMGYDAIEFGGLVAWLFELINMGLIKESELGLEEKPIFDINKIISNPKEVSSLNSKILSKVAINLAFGYDEIYISLGKGKRNSSKFLDEYFNIEDSKSYAVYVPLGKDGEINPTMYWAIGNYIPLPIQGRYWTYYKFGVFLEPEELGKKIYEASLKEYVYDNISWCRFHRRWLNNIVNIFLEKTYEINIDIFEHSKLGIQKFIDYAKKANYKPVYWDSNRVIDLVTIGAKEFGNKKWEEKFRENKENVKEYLYKVLEKYSNLVGKNWNIK